MCWSSVVAAAAAMVDQLTVVRAVVRVLT